MLLPGNPNQHTQRVCFNPWPHGEKAEVKVRRRERIAAFFDYSQNPSLTTKATFDEEIRLMHRHEDWKIYFAGALLVAAKVISIYLFWIHENRKPRQSLD